jgi:hypothetical protein
VAARMFAWHGEASCGRVKPQLHRRAGVTMLSIGEKSSSLKDL